MSSKKTSLLLLFGTFVACLALLRDFFGISTNFAAVSPALSAVLQLLAVIAISVLFAALLGWLVLKVWGNRKSAKFGRLRGKIVSCRADLDHALEMSFGAQPEVNSWIFNDLTTLSANLTNLGIPCPKTHPDSPNYLTDWAVFLRNLVL